MDFPWLGGKSRNILHLNMEVPFDYSAHFENTSVFEPHSSLAIFESLFAIN